MMHSENNTRRGSNVIPFQSPARAPKAKTRSGKRTTARRGWLPSLEVMARAIIADASTYDEHTREGIRRALEESDERLPDMVKAAETLAAGEPEDKTSAAWRYWMLRSVEADFKSGDAKRQAAAAAYVQRLAVLTFATPGSGHLFTQILPHLIIECQQRNPAALDEAAEELAERARVLLTQGQYAVARVLARIIAGGYGGTFRGSYYLTVGDDERARLRERLLSLASRLELDAAPFIHPPRFRRFNPTDEWPVWPHKVFVACVKLLERRRREGRPDELAEHLARDLSAAAIRHEAACSSYSPDLERNRGAAEARKEEKAKPNAQIEALRARLAKLEGPEDEAERFRLLREIYDLENPPAVASGDWPEYIMPEGGAA